MRKSISLLMICAALLCAGGKAVSAPDTEAQARAREAMRQKLLEGEGVSVSAPMAAPAPSDPEAIANARRALHVKMQQLNWDQSAPYAAPATPASAPMDSEATARAREALRQKMRELESQPAREAAAAEAEAQRARAEAAKARAEAEAEAAKAKEETARAKAAEAKAEQAMAEAEQKQTKNAVAFPPMAAPGSPLSASKEARLAELLRRYKADEITPEQYHAQRAKIMAEP